MDDSSSAFFKFRFRYPATPLPNRRVTKSFGRYRIVVGHGFVVPLEQGRLEVTASVATKAALSQLARLGSVTVVNSCTVNRLRS
jgi:hypothetical protein